MPAPGHPLQGLLRLLASDCSLQLVSPECNRLAGYFQVELKAMADRIITMRTKLHESLREINAPGSWKHIEDQIG